MNERYAGWHDPPRWAFRPDWNPFEQETAMQPYVHIAYYSQTAIDRTTEEERLTHARVSALNDLPSFPQGDIEVDHVEQMQSRQVLAHRATDGWPLAIRTEVHLRYKAGTWTT